jgi:hypothetical protein|nr:MAG TPA: hypothetical protein [Caudoviricetes sp.]
MTYIGNEQFIIENKLINITMNDYWKWAYSDLINNINHSVLAEFIVASSIGSTQLDTESSRIIWRDYNLLSPEGYKIEVKSASYIQTLDIKYPDHISFNITPKRISNKIENYKIHNSDIYVFCIYKALTKEESPINLDLWSFLVLSTSILNEKKSTQRTITLPSLMDLNPLQCNYNELGKTIQKIMQKNS